MNYRKLLIAYINHVEAQEGVDCLGWDEFPGLDELSADENKALIKARDEARKLRGDD